MKDGIDQNCELTSRCLLQPDGCCDNPQQEVQLHEDKNVRENNSRKCNESEQEGETVTPTDVRCNLAWRIHL